MRKGYLGHGRDGLKLKDWVNGFLNCLPSLKDYPELLKIPGLIPPEEDAESSYESDETEILSHDEDDSDATEIISQADSDATEILPQVEENAH
jgi:hypothetical protein